MSKKKQKIKLNYIEWVDHCDHGGGWHSNVRDIGLSPILHKSVGWVFEETKKHIVLVPTYSKENGTYIGEMCVIKSCITKRFVLDQPRGSK